MRLINFESLLLSPSSFSPYLLSLSLSLLLIQQPSIPTPPHTHTHIFLSCLLHSFISTEILSSSFPHLFLLSLLQGKSSGISSLLLFFFFLSQDRVAITAQERRRPAVPTSAARSQSWGRPSEAGNANCLNATPSTHQSNIFFQTTMLFHKVPSGGHHDQIGVQSNVMSNVMTWLAWPHY